MSSSEGTVIACNECGALLRYPPSLRVALVTTPYGHSTPHKAQPHTPTHPHTHPRTHTRTHTHKHCSFFFSQKKRRGRKTERKLNKGELEQRLHHDQVRHNNTTLNCKHLGTVNCYYVSMSTIKRVIYCHIWTCTHVRMSAIERVCFS